MNKIITAWGFDPLLIRLADRHASLIIDDRNGNILMNEGDGDDRLNGAVLSPKRSPAFEIVPCSGALQLVVHYAGLSFDLGTSKIDPLAAKWVEEANLLLARFSPQTSLATALPVTLPANIGGEKPYPNSEVRSNAASAANPSRSITLGTQGTP